MHSQGRPPSLYSSEDGAREPYAARLNAFMQAGLSAGLRPAREDARTLALVLIVIGGAVFVLADGRTRSWLNARWQVAHHAVESEQRRVTDPLDQRRPIAPLLQMTLPGPLCNCASRHGIRSHQRFLT